MFTKVNGSLHKAAGEPVDLCNGLVTSLADAGAVASGVDAFRLDLPAQAIYRQHSAVAKILASIIRA